VQASDPPQELRRFVKDGLLESLELVDYSGNEVAELPTATALDAPVITPRALPSGPAARLHRSVGLID